MMMGTGANDSRILELEQEMTSYAMTSEMTATQIAGECLRRYDAGTTEMRDRAKSLYEIEYQIVRLLSCGLATPSLKSRERMDNFLHWLRGWSK